MNGLVQLGRGERSEFNERFLVTLADGAAVEAVRYRGDTLCVSSQVGCAVACPFCASGMNGLSRGLTLEEMQGQVTAAETRGGPLRRVTISGVGEPLHNPEVVFAFIAWCRDRQTPASVTTSGGPTRRLAELLDTPNNGVTISVHAGREETRSQMVPHGPALGPLFDAVQESAARLSRSRRKKLALSYLLVKGRNDSAEELDAFAVRARTAGLRVHLYALNPVPGTGFEPAPREDYESAYTRLSGAGLRVHMSSRARIEANGGCGTLVARERTRRG